MDFNSFFFQIKVVFVTDSYNIYFGINTRTCTKDSILPHHHGNNPTHLGFKLLSHQYMINCYLANVENFKAK